MKYSILTFVLHLAPYLQAQPDIAWQRCYGSSGWDAFSDVAMTSDGGFIASIEYGGIDFDAEGISDLDRPATLMKFDSSFNLLWYSSFGGYSNSSNFFELAVLEDKGFIAFGNTYASDGDFPDNHSPGISDLMLVRTDSLGQKIWSKSYGSPGSDFPSSFMVTQDKGYLLCGYSNAEGGDIPNHYGTGFSDDIIIIKTDSLGNILWSKNLGTSGDDGPISNPLEMDRGYYILNLACIGDDHDMAGISGDIKKRWLVKMDSLGNIVDENVIEGEEDLMLVVKSKMLAVGNLIYHCTASNPLTNIFEGVQGKGGSYDGALAVFNANLDFIDLHVFGGTGEDFLYRCIEDESGNIFLLGSSTSLDGDLPGNYNSGTNYDYWLMKLNPDLELQWSRNFGGGGDSDGSGGYIVGDLKIKNNQLFFFGLSQALEEMPNFDIECGHFTISGPASVDAWLVAFDQLTDLEEPADNVYSMSMYPNPATGSLIIKSKVPTMHNVRITLLDITGKQAYAETHIAGGEWNIDISSFAAGLYALCITQNDILIYNTKIIKL